MGPHIGHATPILAVLFGGGILAIGAIGAVLVMIIKTLKGDQSPRNSKSQSDEAMMIQEIYNGLTDMEKRIESLETILLDTTQKESRHETR